jgi:hypothetical protein
MSAALSGPALGGVAAQRATSSFSAGRAPCRVASSRGALVVRAAVAAEGPTLLVKKQLHQARRAPGCASDAKNAKRAAPFPSAFSWAFTALAPS